MGLRESGYYQPILLQRSGGGVKDAIPLRKPNPDPAASCHSLAPG